MDECDIVDYVKNASGKIKTMLLFAKEDVLMCEVKELIDALEPYCTGTCVDGGKILFGSSVEKSEGVRAIGYGVFCGCKSLSSVFIPTSVKKSVVALSFIALRLKKFVSAEQWHNGKLKVI